MMVKVITRTMQGFDAASSDKLHEELLALLPTKFLSISSTPGEVAGTSEVTFVFTDTVTNAELLNARDTVIQTFVPGQLTAAETLKQWIKNLPVTASTDPATITNAQIQKATLALILWLKQQL